MMTLCPRPAGVHHDRERAQSGPGGQQAAPGLCQPLGNEPTEESQLQLHRRTDRGQQLPCQEEREEPGHEENREGDAGNHVPNPP